MTLTTHCPNCPMRLTVPVRKVRKLRKCPKCKVPVEFESTRCALQLEPTTKGRPPKAVKPITEPKSRPPEKSKESSFPTWGLILLPTILSLCVGYSAGSERLIYRVGRACADLGTAFSEGFQNSYAQCWERDLVGNRNEQRLTAVNSGRMNQAAGVHDHAPGQSSRNRNWASPRRQDVDQCRCQDAGQGLANVVRVIFVGDDVDQVARFVDFEFGRLPNESVNDLAKTRTVSLCSPPDHQDDSNGRFENTTLSLNFESIGRIRHVKFRMHENETGLPSK